MSDETATNDSGILDLGSLDKIEKIVEMGDEKYAVCEADGEAGCRYRNFLLESADMNSKGEVGKVHNVADVEPQLVADCVYKLGKAGERKRVKEKTVREWPARVVTQLFDMIKEMSELDEVTKDENPTQDKESKDIKEDSVLPAI